MLFRSPPACNSCPPGEIYDNTRCTLNPPICAYSASNQACGNNVLESGEECDGVFGLASSTAQRCSNTCTIICNNGVQNDLSCGGIIPANKYCNNGAIQSSAPTCNTCSFGQVYSSSSASCITPICGNGVREGAEVCDDLDPITGVSLSGTCTLGCCSTTPLSTSTALCFLTYGLTCAPPPINSYSLKKNPAGPYIIPLATPYSGTTTWTPVSTGNYDFSCVRSSFTNVQTITVNGVCSFISSPPVKLSASPRTVKRGGTASITWSIQNPVSTCRIIAVPVITAPTATCDASCVLDRRNEANRLTTQLLNGKTDANDPNGGGRVASTTLTTIGSPSKGKKSVKVNYTTIFQSSCGLNTLLDPSAVKARVQVAEDNEG